MKILNLLRITNKFWQSNRLFCLVLGIMYLVLGFMRVFHILDHLRHTATGLDGLPAWFLWLGAPAFAAPIAELCNQSLTTSFVPQQWKTAIITPVPEVTHPSLPSHYRPVSIMPVLSRVMERHIARTFIYPALLTTPWVALQRPVHLYSNWINHSCHIAILQAITEMLSCHPYVHVIALDFSKAFDTVRHSTLLEKLAKLDLPD